MDEYFSDLHANHQTFRKTKADEAKEISQLFLNFEHNNIVSIENTMSDLWSLISLLTSERFLDIETTDVNSNFDFGSKLKPEWILEELIQYADSDNKIRKSRCLVEWLEDCYKRNVVSASKLRNSTWPTTLRRIINHNEFNGESAESVNSIHPDSQLRLQCYFLKLEGNDNIDQETLLKYIYQLVRSGQIISAQQVAIDHQIYWLASSLQGVAHVFYKNDHNTDYLMRRGNGLRSVWLRNCYRYSEMLSLNKNNWLVLSNSNHDMSGKNDVDNLSGIIEMSIYASLSNNLKVLLQSPLISTVSDKLWAVMKAAHESSLDEMVHFHNILKSNHSGYYPGCDRSNLAASREMLELAKENVGCFKFPNAKYDEIFAHVLPPSILSGGIEWSADALLIQLQVALMKGRNSLQEYIVKTLQIVITSNRTFPNRVEVLLTYCLLVLWIHQPCHSNDIESLSSDPLKSILTDNILHLAVEAYIDILIEKSKHVAVFPYLKSLCEPRRVATIMKAILDFDSKSSSAANSLQPDDLMAAAVVQLPEEIPHILILLADFQFKQLTKFTTLNSLSLVGTPTAGRLVVHSGFTAFPWLYLDVFAFFCVEHMIDTIGFSVWTTDSTDSIEAEIIKLLEMNEPVVSTVLSYDGFNLDRRLIFPTHCPAEEGEQFFQPQDVKIVYDASCDAIVFMRHYTLALKSLKFWNQKLNKFNNRSASVRGSMSYIMESMEIDCIEVETAARTTAEQLLSILHCEFEEMKLSCGVTELWQNLELSCAVHFKLSILALNKAVCTAKALIEVNEYMSLTTPAIFNNFVSAFEDVFPNQEYFKNNGEFISIDIYTLYLRLVDEIPGLMNSLTSEEASIDTSNLLYSIESSLSKCLFYLEKIIRVRKVSSLFISAITRSYLDVTIEMGNMFTSSRNTVRSNYWKGQSINMIALLANDKSSLRLYQVIPMCDLKNYMKIIAAVMDDNFI